jgi:hypothetical protein
MRDSQYARRRRRPRSARRAEEPAPAAEPKSSAPGILAQWQWATFPVFAAFALGVVVMGLFASTALALVVFFGGIFCLSLSVAHVVRRQIIASRRRR